MAPDARRLIVAAILVGGGLAGAQPAPPAPSPDKVDAKALMQSGVRLLEARDYLGALAVFKGAYARFPSAKILLNIGTTLKLLDRKAEAANAYQRYLDDPDADPTKQADVLAALAELDRSIGTLDIAITPPDAEVQINDGEWAPAASMRRHRLPIGKFTVRARKPGFHPQAKSASVSLGATAGVAIALVARPGEALPAGADDGIVGFEPERAARSRLGAIALAHLDIPRGGGAARVGLVFDVTTLLQVQAAALLGPAPGVYAGASFAFLPGNLRPFVAGGLPVFFSDGARIGVRGGGGLELQLSRHVSLLAELGVELMLNPQDDILRTAFIPALGVTGRL